MRLQKFRLHLSLSPFPAVRRLLFLSGPCAVSSIVTFVVVDPIDCLTSGSFAHLSKEHPEAITPAFADGDTAPSIVLVLRVTLGASLNHLPPTGVRRSVTFAKHSFAPT